MSGGAAPPPRMKQAGSGVQSQHGGERSSGRLRVTSGGVDAGPPASQLPRPPSSSGRGGDGTGGEARGGRGRASSAGSSAASGRSLSCGAAGGAGAISRSGAWGGRGLDSALPGSAPVKLSRRPEGGGKSGGGGRDRSRSPRGRGGADSRNDPAAVSDPEEVVDAVAGAGAAVVRRRSLRSGTQLRKTESSADRASAESDSTGSEEEEEAMQQEVQQEDVQQQLRQQEENPPGWEEAIGG